jgi:RNA polymerase sigma factor (sigma-70 family)
MPDVSTWVCRCQAGDLEAFSALFKEYQQRVYSLAATILKDEAAADDVVQETFLAMFVKIGSYSGASSFETWLVAITVNCCRDRLRRRKVRRALSLDRLNPELLARFLGGGATGRCVVGASRGAAGSSRCSAGGRNGGNAGPARRRLVSAVRSRAACRSVRASSSKSRIWSVLERLSLLIVFL